MIDDTLDALFSPQSVAVVGASRDRKSIGYAILDNLILNGYEGQIFPVNPKAPSVHSIKCYPSVGAIPDQIDLAVIVVPKKFVLPVVEDCIDAGVKGFVVITAGFAETGVEGAAVEHEILTRIRDAGARMVGPNCMGLLNTDPSVRLNATFAPTPAQHGSVGFVSQSGALGVAILNEAGNLGIGFTQFVSMGNKADVSGNDLIEYWAEREETKVIAMYLESFGNPRKFTEIAKHVSRKKPIIIVKSGRTRQGARAASSHTGALAGTDVTATAFMEQCGIVRVGSLHELFTVAQAFDRCPLPAGNRLGILTNAGGPGIMATDACVSRGLVPSELSASTRTSLAEFLPASASLQNPVDMIASADPESYRKSMRVMLADDQVDMLLAIHVTPIPVNPLEVMEAITEQAKAAPQKPVVVVMMATEDFYDEVAEKDTPPVYKFPESAAQAMVALSRYAEWKRKPVEEPAVFDDVDDAAVGALLDVQSSGYLDHAGAMKVLEAYGIPVAAWAITPTPKEAGLCAAEIGLPVVVKAEAEGLVHKSDLGGVALDLRTVKEVEQACQDMTARLHGAGYKVSGFLVQKYVTGGPETIFGITTEPKLGPLMMFGLGGKFVEVFKDVRFAVPPLSRPEALDVIQGIRGRSLLQGARGTSPVDEPALAEILLRLAQLASRHPRIAELDINPYLAATQEHEAKAVDVRVRVQPLSAVHVDNRE